MLLLDTSFLVEFEDELAIRKPGAATAVLGAHRRSAIAISIITLGEFAEGFTDPGPSWNSCAVSRCAVIARNCMANRSIAKLVVP